MKIYGYRVKSWWRLALAVFIAGCANLELHGKSTDYTFPFLNGTIVVSTDPWSAVAWFINMAILFFCLGLVLKSLGIRNKNKGFLGTRVDGEAYIDGKLLNLVGWNFYNPCEDRMVTLKLTEDQARKIRMLR